MLRLVAPEIQVVKQETALVLDGPNELLEI